MMKCRMRVECEGVLAWLRERVEINPCSSHARHVPMRIGASEVTRVHDGRVGSGTNFWWHLSTVTY